jgi:hypothetical protein
LLIKPLYLSQNSQSLTLNLCNYTHSINKQGFCSNSLKIKSNVLY